VADRYPSRSQEAGAPELWGEGQETLEALTAEALPRELPASSLFVLAIALREQGAVERAEVVLRRTVQLHPADF
jgi:hypothetical protein